MLFRSRSRRWFDRHGVLVVFWGRLIPGIRPFVSLPAGFELMPALTFLLWTTAGTGIWVVALTLAGLALGSAFGKVTALVGHLSTAMLLALLALGILGLWSLWRRRRRG